MTISRVEDMSPGEWLSYLRALSGKPAAFAPDAYNFGILEDFISRIPEPDREAARKVWMDRRQGTVHEVHDQLMSQYISAVRPLLAEEESKVVESTFFGILPTSDFDGYAGFTPRGDKIIILHEGLAYTLNFWANWLMRCIEEGGHDFLADDPDKLLHALTYIKSVWFNRRPEGGLPDIYPREGVSWKLVDVLTVSAIAFVLGHEMGHVINNDTYGQSENENHEIEFRADKCGLKLGLKYGLFWGAKFGDEHKDNFFTKLGLFGPFFTLAVMILFSTEQSKTHPSTSARMQRMQASFSQEMHTLLGADLQRFINGVDEDLISVILRMGVRLYEQFNLYKQMLEMVEIEPNIINKSWLKTELRHKARTL